jgi:ribonucleoside-diphosphate reductase beta chain
MSNISQIAAWSALAYPHSMGQLIPFLNMSETIDLTKEKNSFETHVTEYQSGGMLNWD